MAFLVTGGTGLIGNNVVRLLLERGEAVRVLIRESSSRRPFEGLDVETVRGDIRDAGGVREAMKGMRCVIHSAAHLHLGHTQLELSRAINVMGSRNVAAAAQEVGARMIHVSTVDTLGVGTREKLATEETQHGEKVACSYSISKREAEHAVSRLVGEGLDARIVHPVFTLGPWDWNPSSGRMLLAVAEKFVPLAPRGGFTVADVRDVSRGVLAACQLGEPGGHYILGGTPMSYFDFWKLCAEVSGGSPPISRLGPVNQRIVGGVGDLWARISGAESDVNSAALGMSSQWHFYSSQKAEDQLGYRHRPVREAVEAAWQWLREYGYVSKRKRKELVGQ